MGSNILKGGRHSWGIRPSGGGDIPRIFVLRGGIPRNIAPFWEGDESPGGGGQKSYDNGMGK
jgi:hypothetical protein